MHNPEQTPDLGQQVLDVFASVQQVKRELVRQEEAVEEDLRNQEYNMRTQIGMFALERLAKGEPLDRLSAGEVAMQGLVADARHKKDITAMAREGFAAYAANADEQIAGLLAGKTVTATLSDGARVQNIGVKTPGGTRHSPDTARDPISAVFTGSDARFGTLFLQHTQRFNSWSFHVLGRANEKAPQFSLQVQ